ncbi:phage repressor protein CI [Vibrio vulnificus]|uniref:phage repressor protein CI n=1 Tax=Vibrio vulnificus TaxID=672 RepID=UPI000CD31CF5|nr:phage repressor protein CI [Vibrio vulnificus]MCA4015066.1 phage repressor protein CI [Vibrio vulnificus]POB16477.1 transcriptional regulator [Vibrio vulnificus]
MREKQEHLLPFEYEGGKNVTERLCKALEVKNLRELASVLGVPTSTISTWHKRNLCPYEIVIRVHIHTGVSVKWLTLGEGEPYPNRQMTEHQSKRLEPKFLFDIDTFKILNGKLSDLRTLIFDKAILQDASVVNAMAIRERDSTFIIDKESRQAVNGTYLVDLDGLLSLNEIQRLPGKKLAISFNGSTIQVDELDVKVVGRVALVMEKQ